MKCVEGQLEIFFSGEFSSVIPLPPLPELGFWLGGGRWGLAFANTSGEYAAQFLLISALT